jgi:hypothetical protein
MYWIQNIAIKLLIKIIGGNIMFMVAIFSGLIAGKRRTIDDVPDHLKEPVLADLNALGLDGYGNPLPVEQTA